MSADFSLPASMIPLPHTTAMQDRMCEMIDSTDFFSDLDFKAIRFLTMYMEGCKIRSGGTLFKEGDEAEFTCLILEGQVDIFKEDHNHDRKLVISLAPGKFLGEMGLIDDEPRSGTATAAKDTIVAVLSKPNFKRLIEEKPALAVVVVMKLARLMSQRLRRASGMLVDHLEEYRDEN